MPLIIPNLDRIFKDDPKVGEAFKKVQDYTIQNVVQAAGNAVVPPPPSSTPPPSQHTQSPSTVPNPLVTPPPRSGVPSPDLT